MSKGAYNVFVLVNFLRIWLGAKACNYWFIWSFKITWHSLAENLIDLLNEYGLRNKIIAYVKDEGFNLNIITHVFIYTMKH